jgi:hypothetical protein
MRTLSIHVGRRIPAALYAVGLLLAALVTGCGDGAGPLGADVEARLNTGDPAAERGPGAVIGSGRKARQRPRPTQPAEDREA